MNTEDSSALLQRAKWGIPRRNVRLSDIFSSEKINWLAVLADGYICVPGQQIKVRSFDELESLQVKLNLPSLCEIRAGGLLVEGERALPDWLMKFLVEYSDGTVSVRTSETNAIELIDIQRFVIMSNDMSEDEIEVRSKNNAWYLRMRNDDALIFIAAPHWISQRMIAFRAANVRLVSSEFIFAL